MPTNKKKKGKKKGKGTSTGDKGVDFDKLVRSIKALSSSGRDSFESPPSSDVSCWICHKDGPDDASGEPLRRGCSCQNDTGFAHVSCLVDFSKQKALELDMQAFSMNAEDEFHFLYCGCRQPWTQCQKCAQDFTGYVAVDMALAYVNSTNGGGPKKGFRNGLYYHITAKVVLLKALVGPLVNALTEGKDLSKNIAEMLHARGNPAPGGEPNLKEVFYNLLEAEMYSDISSAILRNTMESPSEADVAQGIEFLEKALALHKGTGNLDKASAGKIIKALIIFRGLLADLNKHKEGTGGGSDGKS